MSGRFPKEIAPVPCQSARNHTVSDHQKTPLTPQNMISSPHKSVLDGFLPSRPYLPYFRRFCRPAAAKIPKNPKIPKIPKIPKLNTPSPHSKTLGYGLDFLDFLEFSEFRNFWNFRNFWHFRNVWNWEIVCLDFRPPQNQFWMVRCRSDLGLTAATITVGTPCRNQFQALKTWLWMVRCHPDVGREGFANMQQPFLCH